jgi:signal transduction histidine kinase
MSVLEKESILLTNQYIKAYHSGTMNKLNIDDLIISLDQHFDTRIWLVNSEGNIVADSRPNRMPKINFSLLELDENILSQNLNTIGNFYDLYQYPVITVSSPIRVGHSLRGAFFFHASINDINHKASFIYKTNLITLCIILITSFILLYIFTRKIVKPLSSMNQAASKYASGDFETTLKVKTNDEIGQLARSLNNMAYELSKLEEFRRSFIANISHDFRSPLTSIKGYVGAILDGTISVDQQDKYLTVVLDETDRLNKLTSDILFLTRMETHGLQLHYMTFDIHREIRKVTTLFEQKCVEKNLQVSLLLDNQELLVYADIDRIQQVLYNLFDNAVKFSYVNGTITIETTEKTDKIYISIKDSGTGIPKENLKYIWDRFYKNDESRGMDKKGTGLGLSIVKEIIKAHDESIRVFSTKGLGTEFVFTLSKVK